MVWVCGHCGFETEEKHADSLEKEKRKEVYGLNCERCGINP